MFLTPHFIFSGAQMTVGKCGNRKVIVHEGQVDHMNHSAARQMTEKDPQSYSMPKTDIAARTEELYSIQLLVNSRHMLLDRISQPAVEPRLTTVKHGKISRGKKVKTETNGNKSRWNFPNVHILQIN